MFWWCVVVIFFFGKHTTQRKKIACNDPFGYKNLYLYLFSKPSHMLRLCGVFWILSTKFIYILVIYGIRMSFSFSFFFQKPHTYNWSNEMLTKKRLSFSFLNSHKGKLAELFPCINYINIYKWTTGIFSYIATTL